MALALAGCSSAKAEPAPRRAPGWGVQTSAAPASGVPFDYRTVLAEIRRKGFTADKPATVPPGPLRAFLAVGTGSADGGYQQVFFFDEGRLAGTTHGGRYEILGQDGTSVRLELPQYAGSDAQCCPSAPSRRHTATLTGTTLTITPPIPADPNHQ
ncbi:LppP/LprE family lipoprotein [Actinoplanes awajinensis]|uniref:Uncharacterized protein n=1 Tax=Actinoplanes awajinensis subsp. mycoplanecinus TaxID=135947 RepID=A0A101J9F2_9ACTN|nr:LppP/LprE family lipoprotein [Actinoplanes awajinensis]KUL22665.1 hypothetical protein ADL15_47780 [Actinoplanes awajinensis subsp. mycoplanecinus]